MLWTIFVILLVLWLVGLVSFHAIGAYIHILLVIAIVGAADPADLSADAPRCRLPRPDLPTRPLSLYAAECRKPWPRRRRSK